MGDGKQVYKILFGYPPAFRYDFVLNQRTCIPQSFQRAFFAGHLILFGPLRARSRDGIAAGNAIADWAAMAFAKAFPCIFNKFFIIRCV